MSYIDHTSYSIDSFEEILSELQAASFVHRGRPQNLGANLASSFTWSAGMSYVGTMVRLWKHREIDSNAASSDVEKTEQLIAERDRLEAALDETRGLYNLFGRHANPQLVPDHEVMIALAQGDESAMPAQGGAGIEARAEFLGCTVKELEGLRAMRRQQAKPRAAQLQEEIARRKERELRAALLDARDGYHATGVYSISLQRASRLLEKALVKTTKYMSNLDAYCDMAPTPLSAAQYSAAFHVVRPVNQRLEQEYNRLMALLMEETQGVDGVENEFV